MKHQKNQKSRRTFLNLILGGSLTAYISSIFYPVWKFLNPPKNIGESSPVTVKAGGIEDLKTNSGRIIRFGKKPVILLKTPIGDIRAFSAICTHLDCTVQYREDFSHIWCACHNGHYNLMCINIAGPPPRPLEQFEGI